MFIYSDHNGDHMVEGARDINRLNGENFNLRPRVMIDETGEIIGIQGGELSLEKSFGIISNLRAAAAEETLRKSQKKEATLKKSFKPTAPLHRTYTQQASASLANKAGFTRLLNELDTMRRDQNQFMKARV